MNEVVLNSSPFAALGAVNRYLPEKNWLRDLQEKQLDAFLSRGIPTRKEELWKYTDVTTLEKQNFVWATERSTSSLNKLSKFEKISLVFINGYFAPHLSDTALLPKDVLLCPISEALIAHESVIKPHLLLELDASRHPFVSLNSALMTDGLFLSIPKNVAISTPIHCIFLSTEQNNVLTCPRNIIVAGANSKATLIEEYVAENAENYFTNACTFLFPDENAQLNYYKLQSESMTATHISTLFINQKQDSKVSSFHLATGSRLAREDILVTQKERGAECYLNGFYNLSEDNQHIDNHLHVDHIAALGTSSMQYKGVLDKKSRAVFNGKVHVHKNAQQINANQSNHNLLLSKQAEINTKPELEIYADDVKCTHGATVGQLDAESLFYLRARGIEKNRAIELLTHAFIADVINKIEHRGIRDYVQQG